MSYIKYFLVVIIATVTICSSDTLWIRPPQSENDVSHQYFYSLLTLILEKTEKEKGKTVVALSNKNMTQMRALVELGDGNYIDVDWAGTNSDREKLYRPIRIPLTGGLLGYRVPVIRTEDTTHFSKIRSLQDLKKYKAIQGTHWPDSDILEAAGLPLSRYTKFSTMYPTLAAKRVDYFPRGINEVYAEVSSLGKEFTAYDKLIIAYKFPMYFFTGKQNEKLAKRLEMGLRMAIDDGSFRKHLEEHPATAQIFPLSQYKESIIIYINNPFLPKETPVDDKSLWIHFER